MFLIDVLLIYYRPAYRLFILDEDDWCAQGRYKTLLIALQLLKIISD